MIAPAPRDIVLEVQGVTKHFGGIAALRAVSVSVGAGETVALVGPNGAGKSTLVACIGGQLRPDAGSVTLGGRRIEGTAAFQRARLGLGATFQHPELFADLCAGEHVLVALRAHGGHGGLWRDLAGRSAPSSAERRAVSHTLGIVGLAGAGDQPVTALTFGERRMLELARAVATGPSVLLADEPSSGLDPEEVRTLIEVVGNLREDRSMATVLVEHDLRVVRALADRTIVLEAGAVLADAATEAVLLDPAVRRALSGPSS
jgi:branched-chain amino acid transport system ATP-binding protein